MDENPRILIVDDDGSTRRTLTLIFGKKGYETETATTGQEAIEKAQGRFFNLALLDIKLPDMEGVQLLAPLKEIHPDMVIIMVTAYASLETAVRALNEGASAYITKPLNMDEVSATVRGALEKQRLIREKRRLDEALRRSKREWEITFDAMSDWISLIDLETHRILRTNRVGEEFAGVPLTEMIGQTCCKLVHGSDSPIPGCPLQKMLHTHQREVTELQAPDGNRWLAIMVDPVMDEDGNLISAVHIVQDITERKREEEAVWESEERLKILFEFAPDAYYVNDLKGTLLDGNRVAEETTGYEREELIGKSFLQLRLLPLSQMPRAAALLAQNALGKPTGPDEFTLNRKDGSQVSVEIRTCPIKLKGQALVLGIARDITERKRGEEETRRHLGRIQALREIDRAITSTLNLTEVLDIILEELEKVIPYHSASIFLFSNDVAKLTAGRGFPDLEHALQVSFPVKEDPLTRELLREKRPLILADAQADERFLARGGAEYVRSWIGVPLIAKGGTAGFLTIDHREPGVYDEESAEMAQAFGSQVAIAIENARLYEEAQRELVERKRAEEDLHYTLEKLREALGGIIQTVALTVETKDPYTAGHQRRVANLARAIATEMGLSPEQIEGIRMAGGIHDLGKISIPAEILSKPTRLTEFEWGIIKGHPEVGYDILKKIEFPWPVAQIVLQHHERLDGSGYPRGLSGEEIILGARILGVADVVEAMASFRPYRPALGIDEALEEISQNGGRLYDPQVVDACLQLFTEEGFEFE